MRIQRTLIMSGTVNSIEFYYSREPCLWNMQVISHEVKSAERFQAGHIIWYISAPHSIYNNQVNKCTLTQTDTLTHLHSLHSIYSQSHSVNTHELRYPKDMIHITLRIG